MRRGEGWLAMGRKEGEKRGFGFKFHMKSPIPFITRVMYMENTIRVTDAICDSYIVFSIYITRVINGIGDFI
jgi:hypothetical protein